MTEALPSSHKISIAFLENIISGFESLDTNKIVYSTLHLGALEIDRLPFSYIPRMVNAIRDAADAAFKDRDFDRNNMVALDRMYKYYFDLCQYAIDMGLIEYK